MSKLIIYTDGGARGNPGPAAVGVYIEAEGNKKIYEFSRKIGETTNNVAEYTAVIEALEWLILNQQIIQPASPKLQRGESSNNPIKQFYLDSTLVVNQLNGLFKVKDSKLRNLLVRVRELEAEAGGNIMYTAIPREKNWQADRLVNKALDDRR